MGCCSSDNNNGGEEGDESTPMRRQEDSDDDSSDDPEGVNAGLLSDDDPIKSDGETEDESDANDPNRLGSPRPILSSSDSTRKVIDRNVLQGWKDAVQSGNDSLVIHLYEEYKEYDVIQQVFDNGDNSLHVACQNKKLKMAVFLLEKGISVNALNEKNGNSALHYACEQRDEKMVKTLLRNRADPGVKNKKGKAPFDIAKRFRSVKIQELIQEAINKKAMSDLFDPDNEEVDEDELNTIRRPTEFQGKQLGGYSGGLLEDAGFRSDNVGSSGFGGKSGDADDDSDSDYEEKPLSKEDEDKQKTALTLHTMKARNPFLARKLDRRSTKKKLVQGTGPQDLKRKSSVADNEILAEKRRKLPELEGWLEKRKPRAPYQWQKRWVIVRDTHILWSDKQRSIEDPSNQAQRKEFNGFLNINVLQEVEKYESTSQNKFVIRARDAKREQTREYMWKAPSREDRNYWVKGLRAYMRYHEDAYKYGIV